MLNGFFADFDPEALDGGVDGDDKSDRDGSEDDSDAESEDGNAGREHYVAVGKSKLRKQAETILLDPKYDGARVSRKQLNDSDGSISDDSENDEEEEGSDEGEESDASIGGDDLLNEDIATEDDEDIDSDMAMGESDDERFKNFKFKGSSTTVNGVVPKRGDKVTGSSDEGESDQDQDSDSIEGSFDEDGESDTTQDSDEDEESESESESDGDADEEKRKREELRQMMAEEQKAVVENVSKAAKADAEKGVAVRKQQSTFDTFLGARIKLQKALTAANSLPRARTEFGELPADGESSLRAAEDAVLNLWNMISDMRAVSAGSAYYAAVDQG